MKKHFLSFISSRLFYALVVCLLLSLPGISPAAEINADGVITNANGSASIRISQPHNYASVFLDTDSYSSEFIISVPQSDQGEMARLMMAAAHDELWYLKTRSGWREWDPETEAVESFAEQILSESVTIQVLSEDLLPAGEFEVYAAYQIAGKPITVSPQPLVFKVHTGNTDRLLPFNTTQALENYLKQGLLEGASDSDLTVFAEDSTANSFAGTLASGVPGASDRVSGTNIQQAGVDEADTSKTDGQYLYMLRNCEQGSCIAVYELDPETPAAIERISYPLRGEQTATGMYLTEDVDGQDRLVTLAGGSNYFPWADIWGWMGGKIELEFFDVSEPQSPISIESLSLDGQLVSSRRVGNYLYLVSRYTPFIEGFQSYAFDEEAQTRNQEMVANASLSSLLPKVTDSAESVAELISSKDCYLPINSVDKNHNPSIISVTRIPLDAPTDHRTTCFLGDSETIYMTPQSLYLATTQYEYELIAFDALFYSPNHTTAIHKFDLEESGINYRGSAQIEGHLGWSEDKKSFRMGENGAYLNIVTSLGESWNENSSTSLTVLKDAGTGDKLEVVDVIHGIGKPGEQLYAARFIGDKAYLVTFRVIDPLYVLDLSDQENPVIVGELEIEGYSDYLHPISDSLLLGVGKDAIADDGSSDLGGFRGAWYQGLKLSLFNVADSANPTEIDSVILGKRGTHSPALDDHHAFTFLPATNDQPARIAIPVDLHDTIPEHGFFDIQAPNAFYDYSHSGLYSFEIDEAGIVQAGFMPGVDSNQGLVFFPDFSGTFQDRSVLLNDAVFYLRNGDVSAAFWGTQ